MIYPELETYDAFLSSGFSEFLKESEQRAESPDALVSLSGDREGTRQVFHDNGLALWTWEYWADSRASLWVEGFDRERAGEIPPFEIIAIFRRALMKSGVVILYVAHRRGSQIRPWADGHSTYGTYLELEIFLAVASGKPIILLREEDRFPEAPLEQLLEIARRSGAICHEEQITRRELPERALAAYRQFEKAPRSAAPRFTALLADRRDPKLDFRTIPPFLFGATLPALPDREVPDLADIDRLLGEEVTPGLAIGERMTRLWLALQAMLPIRDKLDRHPDVAQRWLRSLDRWGAAASWFGLHAHLGVSPIVAQSERARLIARGGCAESAIPFGPLASARYSIGRREAHGMRRWRELNAVVEEAKQALALGGGDAAGYFSIMGHAFLQNGRLFAARHAFERSFTLRSAEPTDARVGEGMIDLGFVQLLTLSPWRGLGMMEDGLARLEEAGNVEFMLKSMKKLEIGYRLLLRREEAAALRARRNRLAARSEIFDQMS